MSSAIGVRGFYKEKTLFITGASGFVGICLLEKILRTIPDHGDIYVLLRSKKNKDVAERLEDIKKNQIFENLLKDKSAEQVFKKIKVVAGDVGEDSLGLSAEDEKLITDNVNVIFHSAATLDFGENLKRTVDINLLGTRRVVTLAKQCSKLAVLIHVSSAYVNSYMLEADEVIYPLKRDPDEVIELVKTLTPEELDKHTPDLLGDHPNTYTITKQMAEHEIQKVEAEFPCTIVRPSMIVGAYKEPVPGWTISKNGPSGFMMGAAKGIIRRLPVGKHLVYDYIPVDIVVNSLLTAGFYTAVTKPPRVSIFQATSSTRNPFRWAAVEDVLPKCLAMYPLRSAVWYPYLKLLPSVTHYKISSFFVHIIPAIILDTITRFSGGKPIVLKLHKNVNASLTRLETFIFTEWRFSAMKTMDLQDWLNVNDKEDFNLDISNIVWPTLFQNITLGSRIYLSKDPVKTLTSAKRKNNMLYGIHLLWQAMIFLLVWLIFASLIGSSMYNAMWVLPIIFVLYNLL